MDEATSAVSNETSVIADEVVMHQSLSETFENLDIIEIDDYVSILLKWVLC